MANELITSGELPVDLSGDSEWLPGETNYAIGEHTYRAMGFRPSKEGNKPGVILVLKIEEGPGGNKGHEDVNKEITKTMTFESSGARGAAKGLCKLLGGDNGMVNGRPNVAAIVGARFKAPIFARSFVGKNGETRKGFDVDFKSAKLINKGGSNGGGGGTPTPAPAT